MKDRWWLFGCLLWIGWVGVCWALPPEIEADRLLLKAKESMNNQDFRGARVCLDKIFQLRLKSTPIDLRFFLGKALIKEFAFDQGSKELNTYLSQAGKQGKFYKEALELINESEESSFTACGKVWRIGQDNINWNETQSWIKSLGDGWRTPTKAELHKLRSELWQHSPISHAWGEASDLSSAWVVNCNNDGSDFYKHDAHCEVEFGRNHREEGIRALAVRSR